MVDDGIESQNGVIDKITGWLGHAFVEPHLHAGVDCEEEFADEGWVSGLSCFENVFIFVDGSDECIDTCGCCAVDAEEDFASSPEVFQLLDEFLVGGGCLDFLFA